LKADGTVVAVGKISITKSNSFFTQTIDLLDSVLSSWRDIVAVSTSGGHTVGLKADGTVVAEGMNGHGECDTGRWRDIGPVSEEKRLERERCYAEQAECLEREYRAAQERLERERNAEQKKRLEREQRAKQERLVQQQQLEQQRLLEQQNEWAAKGRCRYCGGKISFFGDRCKKCGREK
jgi:membrane protein involved in colicin uptake